jgi:hypothetical protein
MVKRKASAKFLAAGKSWREHLNKYRKAHPNLSLKQQMKGASKTYKKGKSATKSSHGISFKTSKYEVKVNRKSSKRSKKRSGKKRSGKKKRSFSLF